MTITTSLRRFDVLLAKIWAIGYALLLLCIILGIAAVVRPSRRKPEKKEEPPLV